MFLLTGLASASNAILSRDFEALKYSPLRYQDKNTRFLLWLDFFFVLCRAFLFHFCVCPDVVSISEMTSGDLYSNISFELVSSNWWFTYATNRLFEKHNAFVETLSLLYQFLPQELVIISVWTLMALGVCKKKQTKKKQLTVLPVCLSLIKQDNLCISGNFFIGMRHMVRKHCLDGIP